MKIDYYQYRRLIPTHIFEYYDFPLFFFSESSNGEVYLNYYVDELSNNIQRWIFGRITSYEKENIIGKKLSVLQLLNKLKENKRLYYLIHAYKTETNGSYLELELINSNNFDNESFPDEDFFVEYDYLNNIELVEVEQEYISSNEFKLIIKDEKNSHSVELDFLTDILNMFNNTVNGFAKDVGSKIVGEGYNDNVKLKVNAFQPSSFGITFNSEIDLFNITDQSLSNLFNVINQIKNNQFTDIKDRIKVDNLYSIQSLKGLSEFLEIFYKYNYSLILEGRSTSTNKKKTAEFNKTMYDKLKNLESIINKKHEVIKEELQVTGQLISVNTKYNNFRIEIEQFLKENTVESEVDDTSISGKMSKKLFETLKTDPSKKFIVPSRIQALVLKEKEVGHPNEEIKISYELLDYEQI